MSPALRAVHLIGLALGVGGATTKLLLLLKARVDPAFGPLYMVVVKPITRLIQVGIVLLTLSGITWLVLGYPLTPRLITKLALVAGIWVLGPSIDKVIEPRFHLLSLALDAATLPAFNRIRRQYLAFEIAATLLFYAVIVYWVLLWRALEAVGLAVARGRRVNRQTDRRMPTRYQVTRVAVLVALAAAGAGCARSSGAPLTPVGAVTSSLRAVAAAQEQYYSEHRSYTTDLAALRRYPGCVIQPGVTITVHAAGARGWAASGFHPEFPGRSCVQWVSAPDGVPVPETTLEHRRGDALPGGVVCDASVG